MRLIIAGSRSVYGHEGVEAVKAAIEESGWTPTEVISGHARGVDTIGEEIADELHVDLTIFPANWKKYGKSAGFRRNQKMVWYANLFNKERGDKCTDVLKGALVAVWDGKSSGTKSIIELAQRDKLPYFVYKFPKEEG
jgi:hypothetical protein